MCLWQENKLENLSFYVMVYLFQNPVILGIDEIWQYHSRSEGLMCISGPHKLTGLSFHSLLPGQEVTDEVNVCFAN